MATAVLDASALLALLHDEPGTVEVAAMLPGARIGSVNLSEAVAKLADRAMPERTIRSVIHGLGVEIVAFDEEVAYTAGMLRPVTRKLGLSLGDRACLALGRHLDLPVLTADERWCRAHVGVEVRTIR